MPTLDFKGKQVVYAHHLSVPYRTLEMDRKKSFPAKDAPEEGNLIIHGDNLHALKALMPRYAGRVNCIYIDPPYNTGNEGWIYNDNVNSDLMKRWLKENGEVDQEDPERHDKWLCMMWPRLQLLRELLAEDGVIFVSIDDIEQHRLRLLMDEIFGEENFVGMIIWRNVTDNNPTNISIEHEYILCYAASKDDLESVWQSSILPVKQKLIEVGDNFISKYSDQEILQTEYKKWYRENKSYLGQLDRYKYIDDNGIYTGSQSVHNPGKEGYRYDVIHPKILKPCKQPLMGYRFPKETMEEMLNMDRILFGEDENKIIEIKLYVSEYKAKLPSVIELDTRLGSYELRDIFSNKKQRVFDYPKPSQLIREIVSFATDGDAIILDSFAGSGTTAHAVLALNKQDGGNRRFILVECEDYADGITAERVRRVSKGVPGARDEDLKDGLGGSFGYYTLGEELNIENLITGKSIPDYDALARHVAYTATGVTLEKIKSGKDYLFGETDDYCLYMIYRPDLTFLRSAESALTLDLAERIGKTAQQKNKTALVFAPWKFVSQKDLSKQKITFCQLPYAIHRLFGD